MSYFANRQTQAYGGEKKEKLIIILVILVLLELTVSTREPITRLTKELQWLLLVDVTKNRLL